MDTLFHSALSENSRLKTMPICHSSKQTPAAKINSKGGMGISNSISEFHTQSNPNSQTEDTIKLIGNKDTSFFYLYLQRAQCAQNWCEKDIQLSTCKCSEDSVWQHFPLPIMF